MDIETREEFPEVKKPKLGFLKSKITVFGIFNIATFLQYFNVQFLPSSMRALEMTLALSPTDITNFTMAENLGLVAFIPIWGALSDKVELKYIVLIGVAGAGIISIWLGGISNFTMIMILRIMNGAMIGSVAPSAQKYIVVNMPQKFGIAFGLLHSGMCAARMISSIVVTTFSTGTYFGTNGWRVCLFVFGGITLALSPLLLAIPKVNKRETVEKMRTTFKEKATRFGKYLITMMKESMNNATAVLMVLLCFFSDGPFVAFNYVTLLIQYMGLSNAKSGVTSGLVIVGGIVGGVIGGLMSDQVNKKSPKYGVLMLGLINVIIRIVTFTVSFAVIDVESVHKLYPLLAVCLFINGMTFMTVSCVDRPIIAHIVMPDFTSASFSIIRCISGVASTLIFNPILVTLRKNVFHFEQTVLDVKDMPHSLLVKNSDALRYSTLIVAVGSTVVVLFLYLIMFFTYPKDMDKIKKRVELEAQFEEPIKRISEIA